MASKSELSTFQQNWQQTAAWAQSKGIKYNDYYPIYQQDSQRLLQYGSNATMSVAERERAIQAAANPNQAFQSTPSTAANPWNIIHNTITDARNVFTGLGDIVIHPLHNGLVDSVKNTFDLIDGSHKLTGNTLSSKVADLLGSTVLSWIPGVADVGQLVQADQSLDPFTLISDPKGLESLAEHPISSVLDILPVLNKFAALKVAGDASFAARAGMVVDEGSGSLLRSPKAFMNGGDEAKAISAGRVAKGIVMGIKTKEVGPEGLMTFGDKFQRMVSGSVINTSPDIADVAGDFQRIGARRTHINEFVNTEFQQATEHFDETQKAKFQEIWAKSEQVGMDKALEGVDDPRMIQAVQAAVKMREWNEELGLNSEDGVRLIQNPRTGQTNAFALNAHPEVFTTRDAASRAESDLAKAMPGLEKNVEITEKITEVLQQGLTSLDQANQDLRQTHISESENIPATRVLGRKRPTPFGKKGIVRDFSGTGGDIDRFIQRARDGEYETVIRLGNLMLNRMDKWTPISIDASETPAMQAVKTQVEKTVEAAKGIMQAHKQAHDMIHGRAKAWKGDTKYRDALHKYATESQESVEKHDLATLARKHKEDRDALARNFMAKRREINERYAKARSDRDNTLKDGLRNIRERYNLAVAKARNDHLLARETFAQWARGRRALGYSDTPQIARGAAGSPEALQASERLLEAQRDTEMAQFVSSLPSKAEIAAKQKAEGQEAARAEVDMQTQLKQAQVRDTAELQAKHETTRAAMTAQNAGRIAREGPLSKKIQTYLEAWKDFEDAVWKHPSDNFEPVFFNLFAKNLLEDEAAKRLVTEKYPELAGANGEHLEQLHANRQVMAQLAQLAVQETYKDPLFTDFDAGIIQKVWNSSLNMLDDMAKNGLNPTWVHHVSSTKAEADKSLTVQVKFGHGTPAADVLRGRAWGMGSSKFDIMASLTDEARQFAQRAAFKEFVETSLDKKISTAADLQRTMHEYFGDEIRGLTGEDYLAFVNKTLDRWNKVEFDPESKFGLRLPRWGTEKVYIDRDLMRAVEKLANKDGFLQGGVIEKGTKLFRFSILGLSPRYTAHIGAGGTMLLALREPASFLKIPKMLEARKAGTLPEELVMSRGATQMGTPDWQMLSTPEKLSRWNRRVGQDTAHYLGQEELASKGIDWKKASPIQWLKALGNLNLRFTGTMVEMQESLAYLAGHDRSIRQGMTEDRATLEGQKAAMRVMGNLGRMSPFERDVARTVMPFYGWQKHILQYVLSYPADHPWRAMMLANMAEYDTSHSPGGLPSRYQFLFFLGTPDAQGNVTAIDAQSRQPSP